MLRLGRLEERKDSFYFLQKSVEQRASKRAMARRRVNSSSRPGTGGAVDPTTGSEEPSDNGRGGYDHLRREEKETRGPRWLQKGRGARR